MIDLKYLLLSNLAHHLHHFSINLQQLQKNYVLPFRSLPISDSDLEQIVLAPANTKFERAIYNNNLRFFHCYSVPNRAAHGTIIFPLNAYSNHGSANLRVITTHSWPFICWDTNNITLTSSGYILCDSSRTVNLSDAKGALTAVCEKVGTAKFGK